VKELQRVMMVKLREKKISIS